MKLPRRLAAGALALLAVVALTSFQDVSSGPIETVTAQSGPIERRIQAKGTLKLTHTVDIGAQVSGQLMRLPKREGDKVEKGEIVAEVDATLARSARDRARYTLESLQATRDAQRAELRRARQRSKRYEGLLKQDAIAREDVESAVASYEALQAQLVALDAQIRQAQATIVSTEVQLSYTTVRSPISGVVVTVFAREGETLLASYYVPKLLQVADLGTMTVVAQVGEADVSQLRIGQTAHCSVLGQPDRHWTGKVRQIKPVGQVVNGKVFYETLFDVENDGSLKSEMTAEVSFVDEIEVLRVPRDAVRVQKGNVADVQVMKDGEIKTRQVKVGWLSDRYAEVTSGLKIGEAVVLPTTLPKVVPLGALAGQ